MKVKDAAGLFSCPFSSENPEFDGYTWVRIKKMHEWYLKSDEAILNEVKCDCNRSQS